MSHGAPREVAAGQARRKAEVVFNSPAQSRLASWRLSFHHDGLQAFRSAIHRGRQSGRTAAHNRQIVEFESRPGAQAESLSQILRTRFGYTLPVREHNQRQLELVGSEALHETVHFFVPAGCVRVQPLIGNLVSREKIANVVGLGRPAGPQHANSFEGRMEIRGPIIEQIVQNGEQLLLRRVPGFQQVVIELNVVDGFDRGIGIRVSSEQCPLGVGIKFDRLLKQFHAVHFRHAMIHQQQRHGVVPLL